MKNWTTPLATLAGIAVMVSCAYSQQSQNETSNPRKVATKEVATKDKIGQKPVDKGKKSTDDQAKKADDKAEASDDAEPKPLLNSITLVYTTWNSSGNMRESAQNGLVTGGFGIGNLSLLVPYEKERFYALEYSGLPGNDFGFRLLSQWGTNTSVITNAHQFSFIDPTFGVTSPSRNTGIDTTIEQQLGSNFGVFANASMDHQEWQSAAPLAVSDFETKRVTLGSQKQVGNSNLGASFTQSNYIDHSSVQPPTQTNRGELRYSGTFGPKFSAQGSLAISKIQVQGQPDSWINQYRVSGVYDVNDESSLGAHFDQINLDLNSVQNAYARKRIQSGVNLDTRLGTWGLGLGYSHREEERLRADHSFVDVPEWNEYNLKLNGRLGKSYRLGIKADIEDLASQPVFQTDDPTLLYWERKASVQSKLSTGNTTNSGYMSLNYRYRRNNERGFYLNSTNYAVGGSRVFSPKFMGYAEFASDQYSVGGTSPITTALGETFPTSETFLFGVDYTRNARENFSFVMTSFYTQDQWGQQIALTYHMDLGKERNFQITYSPWLQRDRLYDVDTFTAPILSVKLGTRF